VWRACRGNKDAQGEGGGVFHSLQKGKDKKTPGSFRKKENIVAAEMQVPSRET